MKEILQNGLWSCYEWARTTIGLIDDLTVLESNKVSNHSWNFMTGFMSFIVTFFWFKLIEDAVTTLMMCEPQQKIQAGGDISGPGRVA